MMERYGGTGPFITSCLTAAAGLVLAQKAVYMVAGAASIPFGTGVSILAIGAGFAAAAVGFNYGPKIYNKLRYGMPKLGRSSSHPTSRQAMTKKKKGPSLWQKITNAFNNQAKKDKKQDVEFTPRHRKNRDNGQIRTNKEHKL